VARSRWPNDAIENLVLADSCNGARSDHLAAAGHLHRWVDHLDHHGDALRELAEANRWVSDRSRTWGLVTNTYGHLVAGVPLWVRGDEFELAEGPIAV
jgi:hypothetical protein